MHSFFSGGSTRGWIMGVDLSLFYRLCRDYAVKQIHLLDSIDSSRQAIIA